MYENYTKEELIAEILEITDEHGFSTDAMPGYLYAKVLYLTDALEPKLDSHEMALIARYGILRGVGAIAGRPDPRWEAACVTAEASSKQHSPRPKMPPIQVDFYGNEQTVLGGV